MSDDLFRRLKSVGEREMAQRHDDAQWRARSAGTLDAAEDAKLAAKAESDPETAHMFRATAPRDDAYLDALTAKALDAVRADAAPKRAGNGGGKVLRLFPALALPMAAAAGLLFWMSNRAPHEALPAYALSVDGTDRFQRGGPAPEPTDERRTLSDGAHLTVVLRPATPPVATVDAWAWVEGDGARHAAGVAPRVESSGTVILEGQDRAVFGNARGDLDLVLAVATHGAIDGTLEAAAKAAERGGPEVHVAHVRVRRP